MSIKSSAIIAGVIALFKKPKAWTKDFYAYDKNHKTCSSTSPDATCFCLIGGVTKAAHDLGSIQYADVRHALLFVNRAIAPNRDPDGVSTAVWNDRPERTLPEVRAVLRQAYKLALDSEPKAA